MAATSAADTIRVPEKRKCFCVFSLGSQGRESLSLLYPTAGTIWIACTTLPDTFIGWATRKRRVREKGEKEGTEARQGGGMESRNVCSGKNEKALNPVKKEEKVRGRKG